MSENERFMINEKNRTDVIRFRVTKDENDIINHFADVAGLNVSMYIRMCIAHYENQFRSREDGYIDSDNLAIDYCN